MMSLDDVSKYCNFPTLFTSVETCRILERIIYFRNRQKLFCIFFCRTCGISHVLIIVIVCWKWAIGEATMKLPRGALLFDQSPSPSAKTPRILPPGPAAVYVKKKKFAPRFLEKILLYLDKSIGKFFDALEEGGWMENSIVVVASDNGACANGGGSTYPLRGGKGTMFDGGMKVFEREDGLASSGLKMRANWLELFFRRGEKYRQTSR